MGRSIRSLVVIAVLVGLAPSLCLALPPLCPLEAPVAVEPDCHHDPESMPAHEPTPSSPEDDCCAISTFEASPQPPSSAAAGELSVSPLSMQRSADLATPTCGSDERFSPLDRVPPDDVSQDRQSLFCTFLL